MLVKGGIGVYFKFIEEGNLPPVIGIWIYRFIDLNIAFTPAYC